MGDLAYPIGQCAAAEWPIGRAECVDRRIGGKQRAVHAMAMTTNPAARVAAITGGARGIGRATAQAFVREGIAVAIGDIDHEAAKRTAAELGYDTIGLPLDVTDRASVAAFLDATEARLGPLDVLVNNAGVMLVGRPLWEEDDRGTQRSFDVNANGVVFGAKEAIPRFLARGRGHLVNVASGAGKIALPYSASYSASKHFVVGLSEALRGELRGTGVEVSLVMPGIVDTELAAGHQDVRGMRTVQAEAVADAIVAAVRHPRFDVFVPKELGALNRTRALVPRRAWEAAMHVTKVDQIGSSADQTARAEYEQSVIES